MTKLRVFFLYNLINDREKIPNSNIGIIKLLNSGIWGDLLGDGVRLVVGDGILLAGLISVVGRFVVGEFEVGVGGSVEGIDVVEGGFEV